MSAYGEKRKYSNNYLHFTYKEVEKMDTSVKFESAKWITARALCPSGTAIFARRFFVGSGLVRATARATAVGLYYLYLNGKETTDALFTPGFTAYDHRLMVQEYDVKAWLAEGENTLALSVGNGWAASEVQFHTYTDHVSVIAELTLEYADGTRTVIGTDESFSVYFSPVLESTLYGGEIYDLSHTPALLGNASLDPTVTTPTVRHQGEWIKRQERFSARLIVTPKGERVLDFGQNLAGYVEIRMQGKAGQRIVLSHGEVLDRDGNFYNENYRDAKSLATYILKDGENLLRPFFAFYGYRYVRLDEYPYDEVDLSAFTSVAVYSDMERTGDFHTGNAKINRLYQNVVWGQRSNFLDIPTDCPQRDERVGWTGDAQIFIRTATLNYNVKRFFEKWLTDMALEQEKDGAIHRIVPFIHIDKDGSDRYAAGWSDAGVICPWEIYLAYGDKALLSEHFPMMKAWVDYVRTRGEEEALWLGDAHWGDWLGMENAHIEGCLYGATQNDLIASAYFYYVTGLLIKAGRVLGKDMREYEDLRVRQRAAFRKTFMKDGLTVLYPKYDGLATNRPVMGVTQTSLALVLRFGLCEESERAATAAYLAKMIRDSGTHLTTGFLGTGNLLWALAENGQMQTALDLLFQESYPSWLFSVNHGATTMWEHWDGMKEDGTFWPVSMNSFNHYAYGSVYDFIFGAIAGVQNVEGTAGYTHLWIRPTPDPRFGDHLYASLKTENGLLSSAYYFEQDRVRYEFTVPKNTVATVLLPSGKYEIGEGSYTYFETK